MDSCQIPSLSYSELLYDDESIRNVAGMKLVKALDDYGAFRLRDHGIAQDLIDNCFGKAWGFFERSLEEKAADFSNSGAITASRFVPFGSEKIRDEPNLDEIIESQHESYELKGTWSEPGQILLNASRLLHEECNRVQFNLLDILSSSVNLPHSLSSIHSERNSFFAPCYYSFEGMNDTNPLRVSPHIDPTTMLFNFQDSHAGLEIADLSNTTGCLSATAVEKSANFIPVHCQPGEFLVLAGHVLRRLVSDIKHSVHRVKRPVGISGFHLNYWIVPDLDTSCNFGEKKEDVAAYLARVFPAALRDVVQT